MSASVLVPLLLTTTASAQSPAEVARDEQGRVEFEQGRQAFDAGEYEEALTHFRASHRLSRRPQLWYNIGITADRLRRDDVAIDAFERFLQDVEESDQHDEVRNRLAALQAARARGQSSSPTAAPDEALEDDDSIFEDPIFYVITGGVIAVVAFALITASLAGPSPVPGDLGPNGVVEALRWR